MLGFGNGLTDAPRRSLLSSIISVIFSRNYATTGSLGADATFTRSSTATVTDFEGLIKTAKSGESRFEGLRRVENQLLHTENFVNEVWYKANVTLTPGVTDPNDGTAAATVTAISSSSYIGQNRVQGDPLKTFRNTLYIRRRTGTGTIIFRNPDNTSVDITTLVTSSWQSFSSNITIKDANNLVSFLLLLTTPGDEVDIAFPQSEEVTGQTNQNPSEYVSVGVESAPYHGANVDGVKYFATENGNTVTDNVVTEATGAAITGGALMMEPAATNLVTNSTQFYNATFLVITNNFAISLDGTRNAARIQEESTSQHYFYATTTVGTSSSAWCCQIYAKASVGTKYLQLRPFGLGSGVCYANFDLSDGTVVGSGGSGFVSAQAVDVGDGWFKASICCSTPLDIGDGVMVCISNGTGELPSYVSDGDSILVYGLQLELGTTPTSYIPTTSSAVTRAADALSYPLTTPQSEGMAIINYSVPGSPNSAGKQTHLVSFDGGVNPNNGVLIARPLWDHVSGDGSTSFAYAQNHPDDSNIIAALRWNGAIRQMLISKDGVWAVDIERAFDGAWPSANILAVNGSIDFTFVVYSINIYDTDQGTAWIEANY